MTPSGWQPENHDWLPVLTETVDGLRVGRDPMTLPVETLTAAGHPPRNTRAILAAYRSTDRETEPGIRRHKELWRQCFACVGSENERRIPPEVRDCDVVNCPIWPYRTGRNPHHPQRGRNPFAPISPDGAHRAEERQ
ncbi:MAG: hypothetical protein AB7J30_12580 [Hyphomicrobium sp.]|uniref:hypothetical protein n=1 Tax=Hyphomicrobium sp. TaxID=82 RepID=UPI003D14343D